MTIRMLKAWNGLPEQMITTLSGAEESRLVGLGLATFDLDGPAENLRMAQLATDAAGLVPGAVAIFNPRDNVRRAVNTTASDQVLTTLTVPAGLIRDDTIFEIWSLWSCTSSANAKAFKILLNEVAIFDLSQTTIQSMEGIRQVRCRGAGSQVATNKGTSTPIGVTSSTGALALTIDLSAGAVFKFVGNRANAGDSLAIEACCVKVM